MHTHMPVHRQLYMQNLATFKKIETIAMEGASNKIYTVYIAILITTPNIMGVAITVN